MNKTEIFIYLVSCAINGKIPDKSIINQCDLGEIYSLASKHMLKAIVAIALESAGYKDKYSAQAIASSLQRNIMFEMETKLVLDKLEEAKIWYIPLKGSVIKNFYPKAIMREMSDVDILFDTSRADDVKYIMKNLGFTTKYFGIEYHDVYHKEPFYSFEMHRRLFDSYNKKFYDYYFDVKNRLIKDEKNNFGYHFSLEDLFIYMTVHEHRHYFFGGTGLRSILDVYVFLKSSMKILNFDYVEQEIEKLGISDFYTTNFSLALNLFDNNELTRENQKMLEYIMDSGTYGTFEKRLKNSLGESGGKIKYLMLRIFPKQEDLKSVYPFLSKYKVLYPILVIFRFVKVFLSKRQRIVNELKMLLRIW